MLPTRSLRSECIENKLYEANTSRKSMHSNILLPRTKIQDFKICQHFHGRELSIDLVAREHQTG